MKRLVPAGLALALGLISSLAMQGGTSLAEEHVPSQQPFFSASTLIHVMGAPVMAQEADHTFLVDIHSNAGVTCQDCHGDTFTEPVDETVCTDCHGSYAGIAAMTPWEPNPHASHLGEIPCATCHNIHTESVSFCDRCHAFGMVVP